MGHKTHLTQWNPSIFNTTLTLKKKKRLLRLFLPSAFCGLAWLVGVGRTPSWMPSLLSPKSVNFTWPATDDQRLAPKAGHRGQDAKIMKIPAVIDSLQNQKGKINK